MESGTEVIERHAEVHDAEMPGPLRGLETATVFQQTMPEWNRTQARIVLFADNTFSVAVITHERPGSSQWLSQKSVKTATHTWQEQKGKYRSGVGSRTYGHSRKRHSR